MLVWGSGTLLKRDSNTGVFLWKFWNFTNTHFEEHLVTTASKCNISIVTSSPSPLLFLMCIKDASFVFSRTKPFMPWTRLLSWKKALRIINSYPKILIQTLFYEMVLFKNVFTSKAKKDIEWQRFKWTYGSRKFGWNTFAKGIASSGRNSPCLKLPNLKMLAQIW